MSSKNAPCQLSHCLSSSSLASIHSRFIIKKLRGYRYDEEVETEVGHYVSCHTPQLTKVYHSPVSVNPVLTGVFFSQILSLEPPRLRVGTAMESPVLRQKCLPIRRFGCWWSPPSCSRLPTSSAGAFPGLALARFVLVLFLSVPHNAASCFIMNT